MSSIHIRLRSWKQSNVPTAGNNQDLLKSKKWPGKMSNMRLVSSKLVGLLFGILLKHGVSKPYRRWWSLVWSCTRWLLSKSGMIPCLTVIVKAKGSWSNLSLARSKISFMCIIKQFTISYKLIWLSTCWQPWTMDKTLHRSLVSFDVSCNSHILCYLIIGQSIFVI
jgi:hypothetical protein